MVVLWIVGRDSDCRFRCEGGGQGRLARISRLPKVPAEADPSQHINQLETVWPFTEPVQDGLVDILWPR